MSASLCISLCYVARTVPRVNLRRAHLSESFIHILGCHHQLVKQAYFTYEVFRSDHSLLLSRQVQSTGVQMGEIKINIHSLLTIIMASLLKSVISIEI